MKKKGDFVETWFDTGAFGATLLYGIVTAAGPKQFTVKWESGTVNRLHQDHYDIRIVDREKVMECGNLAALVVPEGGRK